MYAALINSLVEDVLHWQPWWLWDILLGLAWKVR
jgi:hypothetical protein